MKLTDRIDLILWRYLERKLKIFTAPTQIYKLDYSGICHGCDGEVKINPLFVTKISEDEEIIRYWTITPYLCSHCSSIIHSVRVYKSLNITRELEKIKIKHENC